MAKKGEITRRSFLKCLGGGAALATIGGLGFPSIARSSSKPIKIGQINTTSGLMAGQGIPGMRGGKIAEKLINKSGGILGRKLELIQENDEVKPSVGVRKARKLILDDEVDFLIGTNSSGVGLACVPIANEYKKIFISTSMSDKYTEDDCSPYVFRIGESTSMASKASALCMIEKEPDVKKWAGINPDYVFGRESWTYFKRTMEEQGNGINIIHESFSPFNAEDYKPYISAILESGAEGVFTSLWTGDLINFIKQAKPFGFFQKVKAFVNNTTAHATAVGLGDDMVSFWGQARYYPLYRDTPINNQFIEMYKDEYGTYPEADVGAECYAAIMALKASIEKAGTTKTKEVIDSLEGMEIEVPEGKKWFRPEDHSGIDDVVLLGKFQKSDRYPFWIYDPKSYFTAKGKDLAVPLKESLCRMKKL